MSRRRSSTSKSGVAGPRAPAAGSPRGRARLSDKDALAAQLDAEYRISDLGGIVRPVQVGAWCAAAFVVGSVIPLPFLTVVPVLTREIALFVIVAVALTASAVIGAGSDRTSALQAVTRTLDARRHGHLAVRRVPGRLLTSFSTTPVLFADLSID